MSPLLEFLPLIYDVLKMLEYNLSYLSLIFRG
ncbi:hypothetical protein BN874_1260015 [Candidatus Contendobacter odensis Run_B_J11]|uniref:Uncharacterized protein n=1 Tax=Candidatus Contendobacter odensis Run_B_J11 TaxID=1400861 RepID=A0A7U7G9D4_9GAMM|nr:hypothetical protein BN874_1260015 [Candidatus Contendobacter odensis Run_B_J11]